MTEETKEASQNDPNEILSVSIKELIETKTASGLSVVVHNEDKVEKVLGTKHDHRPLLVLAAGTSESGKSELGIYMAEQGFASRLKILKIVRELGEEKRLGSVAPDGNIIPQEVLALLKDPRSPDAIKIINRTVEILEKHDTPIGVVETVSYPIIPEIFETAQDRIRSVLVSVDAPYNDRVTRESLAKQLDPEEAAERLKEKDVVKISLGLDKVLLQSDIRIWNAGSLADYQQWLYNFGNVCMRSTRYFSGNPIEYK